MMNWVLKLLVVTVAFIAPLANAFQVEVFCTESVCNRSVLEHQRKVLVKSGVDVTVYFLDHGREFERELSEFVESRSPRNESEGLRFINEYLNSPSGIDLLKKANHGIDGLNEAVAMDIEKVPAFVCNRLGIVYGGDMLNAAKKCGDYLSK